MTVNTTVPLIEYTGDNITDTFSYPYKVLRVQDMSVFLDQVLQNSGFTVSGIGDDNGGNVIFTTPPATDVVVRLERITEISRDTDFVEGGPLSSETLDTDFDLVVMALQEVDRRTVQEAPGGGDAPVVAKYS
jgi:hypothetical protein